MRIPDQVKIQKAIEYYRRLRQQKDQPISAAHWQGWKEQDGRWVPVGDPIPPGYVADQPLFEPLPGEEVLTPAFPREAFA